MTADRSATYALRAVIGLAVAAPFWFWKGGLLELESLQFIQQYLDGRSLLQKVFNPYANDFGTYQARELSYFFDFLDAQVFRRLMAMDLTWFIPATALLASALIVAVFFVSVRRYRAIPPVTAALLLLVYLTNYVHVVTMGVFYRSTKPLLAPLLMATAFYIATLLHVSEPRNSGTAEPRNPWFPPVIIFALFCTMALLDRQGHFYALLGLAVLAGAALTRRVPWRLAAAALAAVACVQAYNMWLGPAIVSAVNGYVPNLNYQDVPREQLTGGSTVYFEAGELLMESAAVLLGGVPRWIAGAALVALAILGLGRISAWRSAAIALVGIAAGQTFMLAVMIARLPPVYEWLDHHYWYYPLPFQALMLALIVMVLAAALRGAAARRILAVNLVLVAIIASNAGHWSMYRDRMLTSRWFSRIHPQTALLKDSIDTGIRDPRLIRQYREFFDFCATLSPQLKQRVDSRTQK